MRILGIERDNTACNHYRVLQPLYKMREQGLADILTIFERDFQNIDYATQKIMEADIVVFQRPASEDWLNFVKICQKMGKIIVCDYDDNPFETSPLSPAYAWLGTQEVLWQWEDGISEMLWKDKEYNFDIERNIRTRDLFRLNFKRADLITTTTPILQETFKQINKNVAVLPNLVDFSLFPKCDMVKKEVRIGWQGGSSHYEDLHMVYKAIKEVVLKHDNVKFVYFGDMRFRGLFKDLPENKIEFHTWVQHIAYPYKLATLNLDIGICPLIDNVFNRNKSAIKYFEYSVIGAATLASCIPPYSDVINDGRDGLLVKDNEWVDALEAVVKDSDGRKLVASRAYENVYENHNADKFAHLWKNAYDEVLKRDISEAV